MVRKEWVEHTDRLIKLASQSGCQTVNGDLLIAKQPPAPTSQGGIILHRDYGNREGYFKGFGRIIQLPSCGFASTSGTIDLPKEFKVGDYIMFNHASRYPANSEVINTMFGEDVEEYAAQDNYDEEFYDRGILFFVPFPDVKMIKDASTLVVED